MSGLKYLVFTRLKNSLKDMKNHPSKLISYIVLIALLALVLFTSGGTNGYAGEMRSIQELRAIIIGIYFFTFMVSVLSGLSSGGTFYTMPDVNLLFLSPISPKKILTYGILKQAGTSAMVGFLLFFQYGWLNGVYGITWLDMVFIVVGYAFVMFISNLTAIVVYSFSSSDERRKSIVRWTLYVICALAAIYITVPMFMNLDNFIGIALDRIKSPILSLLPVGGWLGGAVINFADENIFSGILGIAVTLMYTVLMFIALNRTGTDYYEDVLQATEKTTAAITAKKEGKLDTNDINPKNVKVGKTGIGKGRGASVFLYKHLLENRRGQVFILDKMSLLFAVMTVGFAYFMKDIGILPVFAFSVYMMIFSVGFGRWAKELSLPYVYIMPQPAFKKLIMICAQSILQMFIESALIFAVAGILIGSSPIDIVMCIAARTSVGVLLLAVNILIERLTGSQMNKMLLVMIYILFAVILMLPGIFLGVLLSVFMPFSMIAAVMLGMVCGNLAVSVLIGFLCRNILNYAELNNV